MTAAFATPIAQLFHDEVFFCARGVFEAAGGNACEGLDGESGAAKLGSLIFFLKKAAEPSLRNSEPGGGSDSGADSNSKSVLPILQEYGEAWIALQHSVPDRPH